MSRPGPEIPPLSVTDAQRDVLEGWVRRRSTAQSLAQRSRIILACAEGHSIMEVSRWLGVTVDMVRTWRRRFLERGLDGLSDEPRPGVPRKVTRQELVYYPALRPRCLPRTAQRTPGVPGTPPIARRAGNAVRRTAPADRGAKG
ncbi:helix-turn-helix domain-containing protein [Streptomyces flaveolus]|uniref:Helix-turn-helix domain-containing protein n=2 Tax=Streptomyces TaxID=1883 RepID=A0ABV1VD64_9ACTN